MEWSGASGVGATRRGWSGVELAEGGHRVRDALEEIGASER